MKYVVCYSGGHSSALVAVEAVRKYGKENVILLNHDISPIVEHEDIKRFKQEVADYLGIPITYCNAPDYEVMTPLAVARQKKGFQVRAGQAFCTHYLKTKPFMDWLRDNCTFEKDNYTILYGFDIDEENRIFRRQNIMRQMGYKTDFPLAYWDRIIWNIEEIGIKRPITYKIFQHANCFPCLKAGKAHWYAVYCLRPGLFKEAMETEEIIGHSIIKGAYLKDLVPLFEETKRKGICPNDKENGSAFWAKVRKAIPDQESFLPCDCAFL